MCLVFKENNINKNNNGNKSPNNENKYQKYCKFFLIKTY